MFNLVTDDPPRRFSRAARAGLRVPARQYVRNTSIMTTLVVALTCLLAQPASDASAQEGKSAQAFEATVLDLSGSVQRVTVPLYGSVTVETTHVVIRADIVAKHIADVQVISPMRMLITGQSYGTTSVVLLREDKEQFVFEVSVELDLGRLNAAIRDIDPQSNASARSVLGNIVLTGTASGAERATRIVELAGLFLPPKTASQEEAVVQNHLEVAGEQQVLLRCTVAEVSRQASRELGVNGFLAGENFKDGFVINQIGELNPINIGVPAGFPVTRDLPFVVGDPGINNALRSTLTLGFPRVQTQLFIRALVENSLLKILAEPNLVAISGETATFLVGGEFPVPEPQGFQTVTITYRPFGVQLSFTPVVRGHQRIRLRVSPVISDLDFSSGIVLEGFIVPGLVTRSTETTVELGNGQTIAIAGLINERIRAQASQIPGLGDIPVLGALFRSVQYQRELTELVILVTPEIVAPMDAHQKVALPGDEITTPNDYELYALGLLEGSADGATAVAQANGADVTLVASEPDELSVHGPWGHAGSTDLR